jgi:hypothetical protein
MVNGVRTGVYTQAVTTTTFVDTDFNPDCSEDKLKATRHQFYGLYDITELSEGGCLVEAVDVPVPEDASIRKHMIHKNPWIELFAYFGSIYLRRNASNLLDVFQRITSRVATCYMTL